MTATKRVGSLSLWDPSLRRGMPDGCDPGENQRSNSATRSSYSIASMIFLVFLLASSAVARQGLASGAAQVFVSAGDPADQIYAATYEDRYELRNGTLTELISAAWGVSINSVVGGPKSLDTDRFDAIVPTHGEPGPEARRRALQQLLRNRFGLIVRPHFVKLPTFILTADSRTHLGPARARTPSGCYLKQGQNLSTAPGIARPAVTLVCENVTIPEFVQTLATLREASGYLFGYPVADRTGLSGARSFSLTWTPRNALHADPLATPGSTLFDAMERDVGLKLTLGAIPTSILVVEQARRPKTLARSPRALHFTVADIRSDLPDDPVLPCGHIDIKPGGHVRIHMTLRSLILESQGDRGIHRILDRSSRIDGTCWQIIAEAAVPTGAKLGWSGPAWNGVAIGSLRQMVRSLLEERFHLATHIDQRSVPGYGLIPATPRLRTADPFNRPRCAEGWGAGEPPHAWRDPRLMNPLASRLITCQNVTVAEFAQQLNRLITGIGGPVVDETRMHGMFDLSVNFSPGAWFQSDQARSSVADRTIPDPRLISIQQALRTQLGLDLQAREVPAQVLVIDHVDETPTAGRKRL